jgi:hypothetical protein
MVLHGSKGGLLSKDGLKYSLDEGELDEVRNGLSSIFLFLCSSSSPKPEGPGILKNLSKFVSCPRYRRFG